MRNIFDNINSDHFSMVNSLKCPICDVVATQTVSKNGINIKKEITLKEEETIKIPSFISYVVQLKCHSCNNESVWITRKINNSYPWDITNDNDGSNYQQFEFEKLLFPFTNNEAPEPNKDMPTDVLEIYNESSMILQYSPRASAALSRLAIEKLVEHLDAEGKDLNIKIGNLSKKGLGQDVIQMLDVVRIFGNNAVHPGIIEIEDDKYTAILLLEFINLIIRDTISRKIELEKMYDKIPEERRKAIDHRDNK